MLEIRRIVNAWSQQDTARHCDTVRGEKLEHVAQSTWITGHRPDLRCREYLWEHALHDRAVFQYVRNAGWAAQIVFEDINLPVSMANKVRAGDVAPDAAGRSKTDALFAKRFR